MGQADGTRRTAGTGDGAAGPGTALVTGASSGIGAEYAVRLAARGHALVLVARRAGRLESLAARLRTEAGVVVETLAADLSDPGDLDRVLARIGEGDISFLLNNAGINGYARFDEADPALLRKVLDVNVVALTALARAALPPMRARGRGALVNVASQLAFAGSLPPGQLPERAVYAGTKGYVVTFTRTLAAELAGGPLQVQVLCPGLTATEFHLTQGDTPVPGEEAAVHADGGRPVHEVVDASLAALGTGQVVCVPGLGDPAPLDALEAAELAVRREAAPR